MDHSYTKNGFPPLEPPWYIDHLEMNEARTEVHVIISRYPGEMTCPRCGLPCPTQDADGMASSWRHLDIGPAKALLKAHIPMTTCTQHGTLAITVPWAEPYSRFTTRFVAQCLSEMTGPDPLERAVTIMRLSWDDAFALKERAGEFLLLRKLAAALSSDPGNIQAHRGLAVLYRNRGEEALARQHADLAFARQPCEILPCSDATSATSVLVLIPSIAGTVPWQRLIDRSIFTIITVAVEYADLTQPLPPHALVFNAIGDADICAAALELAETLVQRTPAPVINRPRAVLATGRQANAHRLGQLPGVVAPHTTSFPRSMLMQPGAARGLAEHGFDFPLLLRSPGFQTGQHFVLVKHLSELTDAINALPGQDVLVIEYLDARGRDGLTRKYRVMCIDGVLHPLHLALSEHWKVHYFTAGMKDHAERQAEEAEFLEHMPHVLGAQAMAGLGRIRDALGLDYCGFDFSLHEDGRIILYEANATMLINPPGPGVQWDYRRPAITAALSAAQHLVASRSRIGSAPTGTIPG